MIARTMLYRLKRCAVLLLAGLFVEYASGTGSRGDYNPARLVIGQQREPSSLNPALETGLFSTELGMLLFQYLVKFDNRGQLVADAARDVPTLTNGGISRDGRTVIYHLRPGLRFGMVYAAHGARLRVLDRGNLESAQRRGRTHGVRPDRADGGAERYDAGVAPASSVRSALGYGDGTQRLSDLPAHVLRNYPDFNHIPFDSSPVGSGPYVVTRWIAAIGSNWKRIPIMRAESQQSSGSSCASFNGDSLLNLLRTGEIDGAYNSRSRSSRRYGRLPTPERYLRPSTARSRSSSTRPIR